LPKTVATTKRKQIVDLTDQINDHLTEAGFKNGLCHVFALHTTCAITTADLDPGTDLDMLDAFEELIPKLHYRHPHNPEHVPDHIMSTILGPGVLVPVSAGELRLGTWQRVILVELDGPRKREIEITMLKS
jgi:secondary thiamine-phosphate synthase enzyme